MLKTFKCCHLGLSLLFVFFYNSELATATLKMPEKAPYWLKKEKIWKQIRDDKKIMVSVKTEATDQQEFKNQLVLDGVGWADCRIRRLVEVSRDFKNYPQISNHVLKTDFDESQKSLTLITQALGYRAYLKVNLTFVEMDSGSEIKFLVVEGPFRGMNGQLRLTAQSEYQSLIHLSALMPYSKLPMPRFFLEFGLEVVLKLAAEQFRSYAEKKERGG